MPSHSHGHIHDQLARRIERLSIPSFQSGAGPFLGPLGAENLLRLHPADRLSMLMEAGVETFERASYSVARMIFGHAAKLLNREAGARNSYIDRPRRSDAVCTALLNVAECDFWLGRYDRAQRRFTAVLPALNQQGSYGEAGAAVLLRLGQCGERLGLRAEAERSYAMAASILEGDSQSRTGAAELIAAFAARIEQARLSFGTDPERAAKLVRSVLARLRSESLGQGAEETESGKDGCFLEDRWSLQRPSRLPHVLLNKPERCTEELARACENALADAQATRGLDEETRALLLVVHATALGRLGRADGAFAQITEALRLSPDKEEVISASAEWHARFESHAAARSLLGARLSARGEEEENSPLVLRANLRLLKQLRDLECRRNRIEPMTQLQREIVSMSRKLHALDNQNTAAELAGELSVYAHMLARLGDASRALSVVGSALDLDSINHRLPALLKAELHGTYADAALSVETSGDGSLSLARASYLHRRQELTLLVKSYGSSHPKVLNRRMKHVEACMWVIEAGSRVGALDERSELLDAVDSEFQAMREGLDGPLLTEDQRVLYQAWQGQLKGRREAVVGLDEKAEGSFRRSHQMLAPSMWQNGALQDSGARELKDDAPLVYTAVCRRYGEFLLIRGEPAAALVLFRDACRVLQRNGLSTSPERSGLLVLRKTAISRLLDSCDLAPLRPSKEITGLSRIDAEAIQTEHSRQAVEAIRNDRLRRLRSNSLDLGALAAGRPRYFRYRRST